MLLKYFIVFILAFFFPLGWNNDAYGWTSIAPQYWDISKKNDVGLFLRQYRSFNESNGSVGRDSCVSVSNGWNMRWDFWDKNDSEDFVAELLQRGITIVRFHDLDRRVGKFDIDGNYVVNHDARDKFLYLVSLLSGNGIRWTVEVLTNSDIGKKWPQINSMKAEKERLKFSVLYSMNSKAIWLDVLDKIFGGVNKYNGVKILSDPFLVAVTPVNEGSLGFSRYQGFGMNIEDEVLNLFLNYLRNNESYSEYKINKIYDHNKSINFWGGGDISFKFKKFVADLEYSSWVWFRDKLFERGFSGDVLAFPEWHGATNGFVRSKIPVVDLHAYVGELWTYDLNSKWSMPSLFDGGLDDLLVNLSNRWINSRSVITEYGQPYWGGSRREVGIFLPFIAARQDFSFICRHSHLPFEKAIGSDVRLMPYASGLDPVAITSDVFEYILFSSGAVVSDKNIETVIFSENELFEKKSAFVEKKYRRLVIDRGLRLSNNTSNIENHKTSKIIDEKSPEIILNNDDRSISISGKNFSIFSAQKINQGKSIKSSTDDFDLEVSFFKNENNASIGVTSFCKNKNDNCQALIVVNGDARDSGLVVNDGVVKNWGNGKIEAKKIDINLIVTPKTKNNSFCVRYADLYGRTKLKNKLYVSSDDKNNFSASNIHNGNLYPFLLINSGGCD